MKCLFVLILLFSSMAYADDPVVIDNILVQGKPYQLTQSRVEEFVQQQVTEGTSKKETVHVTRARLSVMDMLSKTADKFIVSKMDDASRIRIVYFSVSTGEGDVNWECKLKIQTDELLMRLGECHQQVGIATSIFQFTGEHSHDGYLLHYADPKYPTESGERGDNLRPNTSANR
jgi:hypothetical protein